jgi:hypothetical protein
MRSAVSPVVERRAELGEVLLAALGLVEVPLVRGLGLLDRRLVLVQQRVVLRRAGLVGEQRADRRQDRGDDRDARGERIAVLRFVLDGVVVRAVDVESGAGHRASFASASTRARR